MTPQADDRAADLAKAGERSRVSFERFQLPMKAVRVTPMDEDKEPIRSARGSSIASGFIRSEGEESFLYVCWHTVTGIDRNDPKIPPVPFTRRRYLRVSLQRVEDLGPSGGGHRVGGVQEFDLKLYEADDRTPAWLQDRQHVPHDELNNLGLYVPFIHDAVKLRIPGDVRHTPLQRIDRSEYINVDAGDRVLIVGYPHGYSALGASQPTAVILTRFIAGLRFAEKPYELLLDGEGAPGMSGGPVFIERDHKLYPLGIYTGNLRLGAPYESGLRLGTCSNLQNCWYVPTLAFGKPAEAVRAECGS